MEKLSEDRKIVAVLEILGEMKKAKDTLLSWNESASYSEYYTRISLPNGYKFNNSYRYDNSEIFKIKSGSLIDEYGEVPLKKVEIEPNIYINIDEITWEDIISKKALRTITFSNQGNVETTKKTSKKDGYAYNARFNVLTRNFEICFDKDELDGKFQIKYTDGKYLVTNGCTSFIEDFDSGAKEIHISSKYFKLDAVYELFKGLTSGLIEVYDLDINEKVIGTYHCSISQGEGLEMCFQSKTGEKKDLVFNPYSNIIEFGNTLNKLLSSDNCELTETEKHMILLFFKSFLYARGQKIKYGNGYYFNGYGFTLDYKYIKDNIQTILNNIKGEVLVSGLTERISEFLRYLEHPLLRRTKGHSLSLERKKDE